ALTIGANLTPLAQGVAAATGNGTGWQNSVVTLYRGNNQLPDLNAAVIVTGVGLLNLNGFSDNIGVSNFQNAPTIHHRGSVPTGAGHLGVAGDTSIAVTPITNPPPAPATISGNLNLNANTSIAPPALRSITVAPPAVATALPYVLLLTANISGNASIRYN